jgi:hypothetical protein
VRVLCEVSEEELDTEHGPVAGVVVICTRCGYEVSSFGTTEASIKRCFAILHEECPEEESNFYIEE